MSKNFKKENFIKKEDLYGIILKVTSGSLIIKWETNIKKKYSKDNIIDEITIVSESEFLGRIQRRENDIKNLKEKRRLEEEEEKEKKMINNGWCLCDGIPNKLNNLVPKKNSSILQQNRNSISGMMNNFTRISQRPVKFEIVNSKKLVKVDDSQKSIKVIEQKIMSLNNRFN